MSFLTPAILGRIPPVTIAAVIDVLILAFVIYEILLVVKGTRAVQILLGVLLLVAVYYGARWGRLQTIQWLLDRIFPYLVFAMVVLFQTEIRRALARIGRNPFNSRFSSLEARQASEDIVMAATIFSKQKTGALIVLERDTGLRTFTESGIPMDARVSHDLLIAIFQRGSPLHDGAAIIRKDKIVAAACFLPLSVNPILGSQLGTRHRAAIGISEETDAVAIVVSEETGAISLAIHGSIELDIPVERLAERLSEIFLYPISPGTSPLSSRGPIFEEASRDRSESFTTRERI